MSILQEMLDAAGLNRVSTEIMQVALPSIRLKAHPVDETQLKQGATKFGGSPDLSQGSSWPECGGSPLPFVAQINLSEVVSYDRLHLLPARGMLYFFFDIDAFFDSWPRRQSIWRVLYDSSALSRWIATMLQTPSGEIQDGLTTGFVHVTWRREISVG